MAKTCPVCHTAFENEEFCPLHFVPLVNPPVEADAAPDTEISAQPATTTEPVPSKPDTHPLSNTAPETEAPSTPFEPAARPGNVTKDNGVDSDQTEHEGMLNRFTKKFGDRFKRKTPSPADGAAATPMPSHQAAPASISLPPELREKDWVVSGLSVSQDGIDVWPVQRESGGQMAHGHLVVYASGVLTDVPTYQRLLELIAAPTRARLHAFGTIDRGHRVRAAYELLTVPGQGQTLTAWLADSHPSEERALSLLPGLRALVADWSASGVFPISLDPSVLQHDGDGGLRLVRFGAMWSAAADGNATVYRPEFARSGLLPAPWAAPEVKGRLVVAPQSVVFSLAQILAAALFGQPPSLHDVQMGAVPFPSIKNPELARLLMGGLWPHADGRWTFIQWRDALHASSAAHMPPAPAWSRLMPGAADSAFDLGGESFYRLEDAVAQANQPRHWEEAAQRLNALLLWASGTAWKGVAEGLRVELTTGAHSADWVLVRLTRQVQPGLPLTWRGLDFSDTHAQASLAALAQQAMTSNTPDFNVLRQLLRADLRGAFTAPG